MQTLNMSDTKGCGRTIPIIQINQAGAFLRFSTGVMRKSALVHDTPLQIRKFSRSQTWEALG